MPRNMGSKRVIRRGMPGTRGAINKTRKIAARYLNQEQILIGQSPKFFRKVHTIIASKAMDAAGLYPAVKKYKQARKEVHIKVQELVNLKHLLASGKINQSEYDASKNQAKNLIFGLISRTKGPKAAKEFIDFYKLYSNLLVGES